MACHSPVGQASAITWSIAGTVFPSPDSETDEGLSNVEILIVDRGTPPRALTLRSDANGNFYTAEPMAAPFQVAVQFGGQRYQMQEAAPSGSCNLCHNLIAHTIAKPSPLPAPYLDAGFDDGIPPSGRLFVPVIGLDGGTS